MNKILSIVICVFNKFSFTKSCLNDLSKLPNDHEIIIIDNGSTDETEKELSNSTEIKYVRQNVNYGFGKSSNLGYYYSGLTPNVLFLNNDIRVKENHSSWTQPILAECKNGLVGPTMGQLDDNLNFIKESNSYLNGNSYMSGWCLASSKDNFNKLDLGNMAGGRKGLIVTDCYVPQIFSEEFGIAYFEDTDLSFRAKKLKIPFKVIDIPVVHFGKQTSKQLNTYQLYKTAREIFVKKWKK